MLHPEVPLSSAPWYLLFIFSTFNTAHHLCILARWQQVWDYTQDNKLRGVKPVVLPSRCSSLHLLWWGCGDLQEGWPHISYTYYPGTHPPCLLPIACTLVSDTSCWTAQGTAYCQTWEVSPAKQSQWYAGWWPWHFNMSFYFFFIFRGATALMNLGPAE
jgi:hypothetical protein